MRSIRLRISREEVCFLSKQKETYRKMHPEQFSDSLVVKQADLDRDFMDYFLETISSRSLEKNSRYFVSK